MKRLTLIRHAKSSWRQHGLDDADRPLNKRGQRDAPRMARYLKAHGPALDGILSSPAVRARTTAEVIAAETGLPAEALQVNPEVYLASAEILLHVIRRFPEAWAHGALVGHNPGLTYLAEYLADRPFGNIPTCGVLHLECPVERWADLNRDVCEVVFYQVPKTLPTGT